MNALSDKLVAWWVRGIDQSENENHWGPSLRETLTFFWAIPLITRHGKDLSQKLMPIQGQE